MPSNTSPHTIPADVIELMIKVAAHYGGNSVIDPCCYDPALLRAATFARRRVGWMRDRNQWSELVQEEPQIDLQFKNLFLEKCEETFDVVLWGFIAGFRVPYQGRERPVEQVILPKCVGLLGEGGTAIGIVPDSILVSIAGQRARETVLRSCSVPLIVSLPENLWVNVSARTSLVVFRPLGESESTFLARYCEDHDQLLSAFATGTGEFCVPKAALHERWDRSFHDPKLRRTIEGYLEGVPVSRLGDIAEIIRGKVFRDSSPDANDAHQLVTATLVERGFKSSGELRYVDMNQFRQAQNAVLRPGDIVLSERSTRAYIYQEGDPPSVATQSVYIIRTSDPYLAAFLTSSDGKSLMSVQAQQLGSQIGSRSVVSIRHLQDFLVPLIPLSNPELLNPEQLANAGKEEVETLHSELRQNRQLVLQLRQRLEVQEARHVSTIEQLQGEQVTHEMLGQILQFLESNSAVVLDRLDDLSENMTRVRQILDTDFVSAKNSSRQLEERILRMNASLDRVAREFREDDATAREIVQLWLVAWDRLHPYSQIYLESAERLFDQLDQQNAADWSPFVLQYCRTVENELLHTMFLKYQFELTARQNDLETYLAGELGHEKKALADFAKSIVRRQENHTLGTFHSILGMLKPTSRTRRSSAFLTEFSTWVSNHFGEEILGDDHINCVGQVKQLRNDSAHPYVVDIDSALRCRDLVRGYLNVLLAHASD